MSTKSKAAQEKSGAPSPVGQAIVKVTLVLVAAGVAASLAISYAALAELAKRCGLSGPLAWAFPLTVDLPVVSATLALTAMHRYSRREKAMPTGVLLLYVALSVWLNAVHAQYLDAPTVPTGLRVAILAIAPLTIALLVEMAVVVSRRAEPARSKRAKMPTPSLSSSPVPTVQALTSDTPAPTAPADGAVPAPRPAQGQDGTARRRTYSDEDRAAAVQMAREGHSRSQIAAALGISRGTIVAWTAGITAEPQKAVAV